MPREKAGPSKADREHSLKGRRVSGRMLKSGYVMKTYQDIKSAAFIDAIIYYAEPLLGIRFTSVKKYRYRALCPFHADTKDSFMGMSIKLMKSGHCFGACKGDWDIYDLIMLRKKYRFRKAQQVWAEHGCHAFQV